MSPSGDRTALLLGEEASTRLRSARVVVCGLGAVGSFALEALARAGIGSFRLYDMDIVKESNLNRQILALGSTVGRLKVELARERVLDIAPQAEVEASSVFVHRESLDRVLCGSPTLVIDAIDSFNPKVELLAGCVERALAVVSCTGAGRRVDPRLFKTGDLAESSVCPMAHLLRKALRKRGIVHGIRCVWSTERPRPEPVESHEPLENDDYYCRGRVRRPLGSLVTVVGVAGLLVAHEAIAQILGPSFTSTPNMLEAGS